MARPRKQTAVKRLQGTLQPCRDRKVPEADVLAKVPAPPKHLTKKAAAVWRQLAPYLHKAKLLTEADLVAFELGCSAFAEYLEADAYIREHGSSYLAGTMRRAHPEVLQRSDAWKRARAMLGEFGLSPQSRMRIDSEMLNRRVDTNDLESLLWAGAPASEDT